MACTPKIGSANGEAHPTQHTILLWSMPSHHINWTFSIWAIFFAKSVGWRTKDLGPGVAFGQRRVQRRDSPVRQPPWSDPDNWQCLQTAPFPGGLIRSFLSCAPQGGNRLILPFPGNTKEMEWGGFAVWFCCNFFLRLMQVILNKHRVKKMWGRWQTYRHFVPRAIFWLGCLPPHRSGRPSASSPSQCTMGVWARRKRHVPGIQGVEVRCCVVLTQAGLVPLGFHKGVNRSDIFLFSVSHGFRFISFTTALVHSVRFMESWGHNNAHFLSRFFWCLLTQLACFHEGFISFQSKVLGFSSGAGWKPTRGGFSAATGWPPPENSQERLSFFHRCQPQTSKELTSWKE